MYSIHDFDKAERLVTNWPILSLNILFFKFISKFIPDSVLPDVEQSQSIHFSTHTIFYHLLLTLLV